MIQSKPKRKAKENKPEETKPGEAQPEETKESEQVGKPDKKNKLEEAKNGLDIQDDVHDETNSKNHLGLTLLTGEYLKGVDVKTFLMSPAPKGYLVQCLIKREKGGLLSYSKYFLSLSHQPVFLMGAKKQKGNKSSNYAVGTNEKDFSKKAAGFLGKVRSNFVGTEFIIYDHGLNPKKSTAPEKNREQLGAVLYESNVLGSKGPRKMKVLVPDVKEDGEVTHFKPASGKEGLLADFQAGKVEGFKVYINKSPKWNDKVQAFVLNFHGRVKTASVKNFQLIDEKHDEKVLLQFGRTDKSHFIMDYQWPLTAYQAFSICLSSFDYKLACE